MSLTWGWEIIVTVNPRPNNQRPRNKHKTTSHILPKCKKKSRKKQQNCISFKKPRVVPVTSPIVAAYRLCEATGLLCIFKLEFFQSSAHTQVLQIRALHLISLSTLLPSTPLKKNQWPSSSRLCTQFTYLPRAVFASTGARFVWPYIYYLGTSVVWFFLSERTFHCGFDIINKDWILKDWFS